MSPMPITDSLFPRTSSYQHPPSQRSIFGPNPVPVPASLPAQRNLHLHPHKPVQPSPLRAQANSTLTTSAGSRSVSLGEGRKVSGGEGDVRKSQERYNVSLTQGQQGQGRRVMGVIDGVDNIRPVNTQSSIQSQRRISSEGKKPLDLMEGPGPKVRIVSASNTQMGRSTSQSSRMNVGNATSGTGDLTGLTGMLATPAKGLLHRRMADDGERRQSGGKSRLVVFRTNFLMLTAVGRIGRCS